MARSQEGHNAATFKGSPDGGGSYSSFNHENIIALIIRHVRREFQCTYGNYCGVA